MSEINFYYLEEPTLSNLNRIFGSADIPFIRLSKFLSKEKVNFEMKSKRDEKIGFYKRYVRPSHLGDFWESKDFLRGQELDVAKEMIRAGIESVSGNVSDLDEFFEKQRDKFSKKQTIVH